jgi:hypothetical protein
MKQYKINLRNLNIFHTWPSVPEEKVLRFLCPTYPDVTPVIVTIPAGNWDAYSLGAYITSESAAQGAPVTFTYDSGRLGYLIDPPIRITFNGTAEGLVGFPDGYVTDLGVTESVSLMPIRLSGPSRIHVNTNLSLYTLPSSGRLGTVPVDVNYGELLSYFDNSAGEASLCMDHHLNRIEIHLVDQDNVDLTGFEDIPWGCIISLTATDNEGFASALDPIIRPKTDEVVIET